jgi:hypothetical protein
MRAILDQRVSGFDGFAPPPANKHRILLAAALAAMALLSTCGMAQQPYGNGTPDADEQAQYPQPIAKPSPDHYPQASAPIVSAQPQNAQPQYQYQQPQPSAQPQYQQPQVPQPQYQPPQQYGQQFAQPQYQQPQYGQPQYQQPQYAQQPGDSGQQPNGQYADQGQPYGQPYGPGTDQGPDMSAPQPAPTQQPLSANDLEQLLAPIALYPDNLLAQILAASTYPEQVAAADQWLHQMQGQGQDQVAAGAEAQGGWDPSAKGLTAFPQVLDMMNQDLEWTTDLGNAYYNQPQDVMQTVQVLRDRAQQAGNLQTTPQEQVSDDQGYLEVAPENPEEVYVPSYNPWNVYGAPIAPYPGYSVMGGLGSFFGGFGSAMVQFGPGIGLGAFDRFPFGFGGWGLGWFSHGIFFNHGAYYTHSASVADWGFPHGGQRVFGARRGLPGNGYRSGPQPYNRNDNRFDNRAGGAYAGGRGQEPTRGGYAGPRPGLNDDRGGYARAGGYTHPEAPTQREGQQAYNRAPQQNYAQRPQGYAGQQNYPQRQAYPGAENYARGGTGYGYGDRPAENYASRPGMGYPNAYSGYRAPSYQSPAAHEPTFRQPAYRAPEMNAPRGFTGRNENAYGDFARNERSSGFRPYGGGERVGGGEREPKSFRQEGFGGGHAPRGFGGGGGHAPKAPRESHGGGGRRR